MLGGVILQLVAAVLGIFVYLASRASSEQDTLMEASGISWSVAAGLFVGGAEILSFIVNSKGVPATQSIPVIIGASVLFGVLIGRVVLSEEVSYRGWIGVLLITLGITFVGMEPGAKAH